MKKEHDRIGLYAQLSGFMARFSDPGTRLRLLWGLLCFVLVAFLIYSDTVSSRLNLRMGEVASADVEAPRSFVDRPETERLRQEAADAVAPYFARDGQVESNVNRTLDRDFDAIRRLRAKVVESRGTSSADGMEETVTASAEGTGTAEPVGSSDAAASGPEADPEHEAVVAENTAALRQALGLDLPDASLRAVLTASDEEFTVMENDLREVVVRVTAGNITPGDLPTFEREAVAEIRALGYPRPLTELMVALAGARLQPNFYLDEERTRQQREATREAIRPVMVLKGEVIVRRGERITAEDMVRLEDAGVLRQGGGIIKGSGALMVAALLVGSAGAGLFFLRPTVFGNTQNLFLFGIICLGAALLTKVLWPLSPLLAPVPGAAMMLALLLDPLVAIIAAVLLSLLTGFMSGQEVLPAAVAMIGGLAGVFGVYGATQRGHIIRAGFVVALAQAVAITGLELLGGAPDRGLILRDIVTGAANGILLAGVLTAGSLSFFENTFGILTPLKLLELSDPNQPLLRRLLLEAPGTYHHSLMVANLAEAGAEAVGANALLARVGSYYHDVGKVKRPYFFVENQFGGRNPHDKLSPHLSALIVTSHVKEGVELARRHRLPEEIIRFIAEHHGTSLLTYFFQRAISFEGDAVEQGGFRHGGPIPQLRETAVVMLADAAEAAVRSLSRPAPGRIQAAVRKVIRDRLNDGQLDQCDLTLKDLNAIADAFVRILGGVYHSRIEYPENSSLEEGKGDAGDDGVDSRKKGLQDNRSAG